MVETVFIKELGRVKKAKQELEKALNIKITLIKEGSRIEGEQFDEYIALKAIEALDMGFDIKSALKLKSEDCMFETISIKKYARQSRVQTIKGRIIGKRGMALKALSKLTGCDMRIKGYDIGLIGKASDIEFALTAIKSMIHGSPHSNVYAYLEKSRHLREIREEEESLLKK